MAGDQPYQDDDEKRGSYLNALINPIAAGGGDPDQLMPLTRRALGMPPPNPDRNGSSGAAGSAAFQMQGTQYSPRVPGDPKNGFGMTAEQQRPQPSAAAPQPQQPASPPTAPSPPGSQGGSGGWPEYYNRMGAEGQLRNAQAAEQTVQGLANQPDESTATRGLTDKRAKDAAYLDPRDPNHPEYRPGIGTRIFRGIKGVADGIARGGVLGGLAEGLNTDYSAPTKAYGRAQAKQTSDVASDDAQISEAQKAYQDYTNRQKAQAAEQRGVATSYNDVATAARGQEQQDNEAARNTETANRDRATAAAAQAREAQTTANENANLKLRGREVSVQESRLAWEKATRAAGGGRGGAAVNDEIRQADINQAQNEFEAYKADMHYVPPRVGADGKQYGDYYTDAKGKRVSTADYIDRLNKFGVDLDQKLATKNKPVLGLRYKAGPNGQEIPYYTPESQQQAASASAKPQVSSNGELPPQAVKQLKPGKVTIFNGGERWQLDEDGKPEQVDKDNKPIPKKKAG